MYGKLLQLARGHPAIIRRYTLLCFICSKIALEEQIKVITTQQRTEWIITLDNVKPRDEEFIEVALLPSDYKTVCLPFPFPNKNGVQFKPNCSIIEKIPPKGESFADFIAAFAMSVGFDTYFDVQH